MCLQSLSFTVLNIENVIAYIALYKRVNTINVYGALQMSTHDIMLLFICFGRTSLAGYILWLGVFLNIFFTIFVKTRAMLNILECHAHF